MAYSQSPNDDNNGNANSSHLNYNNSNTDPSHPIYNGGIQDSNHPDYRDFSSLLGPPYQQQTGFNQHAYNQNAQQQHGHAWNPGLYPNFEEATPVELFPYANHICVPYGNHGHQQQHGYHGYHLQQYPPQYNNMMHPHPQFIPVMLGRQEDIEKNAEAILENKDLWGKFNQLGTEMIITRSGRQVNDLSTDF